MSLHLFLHFCIPSLSCCRVLLWQRGFGRAHSRLPAGLLLPGWSGDGHTWQLHVSIGSLLCDRGWRPCSVSIGQLSGRFRCRHRKVTCQDIIRLCILLDKGMSMQTLTKLQFFFSTSSRICFVILEICITAVR